MQQLLTPAIVSVWLLSNCVAASQPDGEQDPPLQTEGFLPLLDYSGDLWESKFLLGDLGGTPGLLAEDGFQFDADWIKWANAPFWASTFDEPISYRSRNPKGGMPEYLAIVLNSIPLVAIEDGEPATELEPEPKSGAKSGSETGLVDGKVVAHWTGLPIWGVDARERGFEIPETLGISANMYWEKQPFKVNSIKIGQIGQERREILGFVQVGDADTKQSVFTTRWDVWVFPFLNIYGILGYSDGTADIDLTIPPIPILGYPGDQLMVNLEYEGPVYGGGFTLAGGFEPIADRKTVIFVVADFNFTITDLEFSSDDLETDTKIHAFVFSGRIGVRDVLYADSPVGKIHGALWVGAMYQDVDELLVGDIPNANLSFAIEQESTRPWNLVLGGRIEIGRNFELMVEAGLGQRQSILIGGTLRF